MSWSGAGTLPPARGTRQGGGDPAQMREVRAELWKLLFTQICPSNPERSWTPSRGPLLHPELC
eukprot:3366981-Pyramimonas_sp.AAC.1